MMSFSTFALMTRASGTTLRSMRPIVAAQGFFTSNSKKDTNSAMLNI